MKAHPAAELFPLMGDAELAELAADIKAHGLREPITTYGGMILDGRNRHRACEIAVVEPRFAEWDGTGGSPTDFVVSLNLHRRHLTKGQWAMIAADSRRLYEAEARERQRFHAGTAPGKTLSPTTEEVFPVETAARAAEAFGVGKNTVYEAARLQREAPALAAEVKAGNTSVGTAVRQLDGKRKIRNGTITRKNRHKEVLRAAEALARVGERWEREMTDELAPPEARKQLTILSKASAVLAEVTEAVEYRAATLHSYNVQRRR